MSERRFAPLSLNTFHEKQVCKEDREVEEGEDEFTVQPGAAAVVVDPV